MQRKPRNLATIVSMALLVLPLMAHAEGKLSVLDAWIRAAPPGAGMLAAYATLKNIGDTPISVLTVQSDTFRQSSIHETVVNRDVTRMRELPRLDLDPGATIEMKPGGRHIMLSEPRRDIVPGEKVDMVFLLSDGTRVQTNFEVLAADSTGDK